MDDDDEFGDLYTDVIAPFSSTLSYFHQQPSSSSASPAPPPVTRPISIKLQSDNDGRFLSHFNSDFFSQQDKQSLVGGSPGQESKDLEFDTDGSNLKPDGVVEDRVVSGKNEFDEISKNMEVGLGLGDACCRVSEGGDVNLAGGDGKDGFALDTEAPGELDVGDDGDFRGKEMNFGIEDDDNGALGDFGEDLMIPGLGSSGVSQGVWEKSAGDGDKSGNLMRMASSGGVDEWDSDDSEDDLHIVLNDANHGPMAMEKNVMVGIDDDDEDEDGGPLVIVSDTDAVQQPAEPQEWGDDTGQTPEGDGKENPEAAKANGAVAIAPKVGFSNYGYHPFHSQFKYIRPGAAPLPSAPPVALGGASGQVRPPTSINAVAGRGRGDWRPAGTKAAASSQKGFQPGFWASNMPGRSFGGLEFTLPSHKTIFEVDIDLFEEKPWKYPGIDVSDFFNFGLNEETWKEYCRQLEQIRMESKMQSRIHVYESGRSEQAYDPDLPPELAAAAGHDPPAKNAIANKLNVEHAELEKGVAFVPQQIPIGKAIQVEVGYGERLPYADTRPPRYRDSNDAIIVLVSHSSPKGDSAAVDVASEQGDYDESRGDHKVDVTQRDSPQLENHYSDENQRTYHDVKGDSTMKASPTANPLLDGIPLAERDSSSPSQTLLDEIDGSRDASPTNSGEDIRSLSGEGQTKAIARDRSHTSSDNGRLDGKSSDDMPEVSNESVRRKYSPEPSSPALPKDCTFEDRIASDNEHVPDDVKSGRKGEDASKDDDKILSTRKKKLSPRLQPPMKGADGVGNLKSSRSSENSKATESGRDHHKLSDDVDEEVSQDGHPTFPGDIKRAKYGDGQVLQKRDHDRRTASERNYSLAKGRDDTYTHRDWDPYAARSFHAKTDGLERRKERNYPEEALHRREDDPHGRKVRAEGPRKHEHADEVSRHRGKVRETERSEKDELLHSKKVMENGSWRGNDKDVGPRRRDSMEDLRSKRRMDDIHIRRDHTEKEETLLVHRESSSRRKRERDEQPRDNSDERHSVRQKDESWLQRERTDRHELHGPKQSYEENLSRRERDDVRGAATVRHSRPKDDYKGYDKDYLYKGTGRNRGSEEVFAYGNQYIHEEKRSRQERSGARSDLAVHATDSQRVQEKKHKDSRKVGGPDVGQSKGHREEKIGTVEMAGMKGMAEQGNAQRESSVHHQHNRNQRDNGSSGDEQQSSKRGRSKLERWTSHKERNFDVDAKSSSSSKIKDNGVVSGSSANMQVEPTRKTEVLQKDASLGEGKDAGSRDAKDSDKKPTEEDRHLDTVEKLKKRSERFRLPMPSEKEAQAMKKMETEPLPSSQNKGRADSEVKQDRPARKRRWISS